MTIGLLSSWKQTRPTPLQGKEPQARPGALTPMTFNALNPAGSAIDYNWMASTDSQVSTFTTSEAGTYFIEAAAEFVYAGPYTFTVTEIVDDFSANTDTEGSLSVDGSTTGFAERINDRDWFAVELLAGTTYIVELEGTDTELGTLNDPRLYGLFDDAGQDTGQGYDDDGGFGYNSRAMLNVADAGTYYISAGSYGSGTGSYALSLSTLDDDFADSVETTGVLAVDGSVDGVIDYDPSSGFDNDRDWFAVTLEASSIYRFEVSTPDDLTDPANDVRVTGLFDDDGNSLASNTELRTLVHIPSEAQTVYVQVESHGYSDLGQYRLSADALYLASGSDLPALPAGTSAQSFDAAETPYYLDTVGSLGRDAIVGTPGDDVLRGLSGADTIIGGEGDDLLTGDDGMASDHNILDAARVYRAYDAILGRTPDAQGHAHFTALGQSLSATELGNALINSTEFSHTNGTLTNAEFIDLLYANLRGPDGAGEDPARETHLERLDSGWWDRGEVAQLFFDSQEQMDQLDDAAIRYALSNHPSDASDDVFGIYQALLERAPDINGFENWAQSMSDGLDLSGLAEKVMGSQEFALRGVLGDRDFAEQVLTGLNGGTPGPVDLDTATAILHNGVARSDFVAAMLTLSEPTGLTEWMRAEGADDVLLAGAGKNTLMGGLKSDTFVFMQADGSTNTVLDLEAWDYIDLDGFGYTTQAQARAVMTEVDGNLLFEDQGVQINFVDTMLADISDEMILI